MIFSQVFSKDAVNVGIVNRQMDFFFSQIEITFPLDILAWSRFQVFDVNGWNENMNEFQEMVTMWKG